jgi:hypothetical protein
VKRKLRLLRFAETSKNNDGIWSEWQCEWRWNIDKKLFLKIVTIRVPIVETTESIKAEFDDLVDERSDFSVGDFVWGKIKNHWWWPDLVYG